MIYFWFIPETMRIEIEYTKLNLEFFYKKNSDA